MPPQHGYRSAEKSSQRGGFACIVCRRKISEGDPIVGFHNANKPAPINWDHVCAKPCADQYKAAPLGGAAAPSTSAPVAESASDATASSRQPSDDDAARKSDYFNMAETMEFTLQEATAIVEQCEGNFKEARKRLGDLFLQRMNESDDDDRPDADGSNDDQGGSSGEEETLPEKPLARSVAP